mmetsp:Transcript_20450/g.30479  ORF Transcript_20450/g.30479 Transcript_20450/m.30479 type:complete len:89 (+) Transcript_20450:36-302(+)
MPIKELHRQGLVGRDDKNRGSLPLFPPWSGPKRCSTQSAKAHQQQFFIDTSNPSQVLNDEQRQRLRTLVLSSQRDWEEPDELRMDMLV